MNQLEIASCVVFLIAVLTAGTPLWLSASGDTGAQSIGLAYTLQDTASRVVLEGSSTLTDWSCESSDFEGFLSLPLRTEAVPEIRKNIKTGSARELRKNVTTSLLARPRGLLWIPVRSFECDNERMTRDMQQALKANDHPYIIFQYNRLHDVNFPEGSTADSVSLDLALSGGLAMAGSANGVELRTTVREHRDRTVELSGTFTVRMTDFDVTPPTALMGLIEVHDRVTVKYNLSVRPTDDRGQAREIIKDKIREYGNLLRGPIGLKEPTVSDR